MSRPFEEFTMNGSPRDALEAQPSARPGTSTSSEGDVGEDSQPIRTHRQVKRNLNSMQIFLITVSGTIGMGLFDNSGEILRIAGPAGGLMAYIVVGICVICVMDGLGEMIGHWAIPNCMVEFVAKFVDKDLAIVVGLAYWYCYAIGFATLVVAAANLASFWEWSTTIQNFMFTFGIPGLLICINCLGVLWYAYVESVLGGMKIALVLASFLTMVAINHLDIGAKTPNGEAGSTYIDDGFQHDPTVASNNVIAVLVAIPIVAYAYVGVEIVAVTALEAEDPKKSLKFPAKWIAWLTFGTYFISAIGFYLNAAWNDPSLPVMEGRKNETLFSGAMNNTSNSTTIQSTAIVIVATMHANIPALPSILNIGLIFAVLSTSNTSLYVASRTLFGITRGINPKHPSRAMRWLSRLSRTSPRSKVPTNALAFSAAFFCWIPFLRLSKSYTDQEIQEIMSGIATVAVVLVWAALCLAFIRYRMWLKMYKDRLKGKYQEYNLWEHDNDPMPFRTILCGAQPVPAYIGLISCLLIVFVFATSSWWDHGEKAAAVWASMAGPIILTIVWFVLKYFRYYGKKIEWYVKLGTWGQLSKALNDLKDATREDVDSTKQATRGQRTEVTERSQQQVLYPSYPGHLEPSEMQSAYIPIPQRGQDSNYGGSGSVSPTTRPNRYPKGEQDVDGIELLPSYNRSPRRSSAGNSNLYDASVAGTVPRRKPVSNTSSGLGIGIGDRNSGESMGSQDLMLPREGRSRQPSFESATGEYNEHSTTPRRSRNELAPPDRHEGGSSRFARSQSSDLDVGHDLENQGARRHEIWGQHTHAYGPALSPQSPPLLAPPQWNPSYVGRAVSEPDEGVRGQTLHRQRGMSGLRGRH
ncbi:uncharacterized protein PAC_01423 [Phialocephala subalpina]|uniref:Amino acid permease/ SLC12A domain-containing protein n=1 Tax=Phialocephala subalpina TaxID=576137 RepID=A0A1L7WFJ5_9HELO|nr:uncharacterized protein PAC_01423 [Phialocephala subalpina]